MNASLFIEDYLYTYNKYVQIRQTLGNHMAVACLNLPAFTTFDLTEKDTLKTWWNKYLKRFNALCKAIGVINEGQKLSMSLTYVGNEMY